MPVAIRVENLSKKYSIGSASLNQHGTLRDDLISAARTAKRAIFEILKGQLPSVGEVHEEFWALKDLNFEVPQGEVLGIIGRNGAGKSTLLKIISRITEPTKGRITLRGTVASLLEVGTGFHPELTGRENIFLNGAILGMSRQEIQRKFDEIVEFAETEQFLDTPVKRYSSGMYVRLAFAVAAHLDPEILIVDEVLAVGDAKFQAKCLGSISGLAKSGRTVILVSHNMRAIQTLCTSAILLESGKLALKGSPQQCAQRYLQFGDLPNEGFTELSNAVRRGSGKAKLISVELCNRSGEYCSQIAFGEPVKVRLKIHSLANIETVTLGFSFITSDGIELMGTAVHDSGIKCDLVTGTNYFECDVSPMLLTPGRFTIRAAVFTRLELFDHIDEIMGFEVIDLRLEDSDIPINHYVGMVYYPYKWKIIT